MKLLNRDVLKYLAIVLMFMDHMIQIFMERVTFQYNLLYGLIHFTFVTMSYFLVEGYRYTKSNAAYAKRIFLFGLISQIPYALAFSLGVIPLNIFFTLGVCFLMVWALDSDKNVAFKAFVVMLCIIICVFSDWTIYAPLFTLAFYWARDNKRRLVIAYLFEIIIYGASNISGYLVNGDFITAATELLLASSGIILSGICILGLYNGKQMKRGRKFHKWFFYLFYPAHLLVLGILRIGNPCFFSGIMII